MCARVCIHMYMYAHYIYNSSFYPQRHYTYTEFIMSYIGQSVALTRAHVTSPYFRYSTSGVLTWAADVRPVFGRAVAEVEALGDEALGDAVRWLVEVLPPLALTQIHLVVEVRHLGYLVDTRRALDKHPPSLHLCLVVGANCGLSRESPRCTKGLWEY